jgi:hypothetical protein
MGARCVPALNATIMSLQKQVNLSKSAQIGEPLRLHTRGVVAAQPAVSIRRLKALDFPKSTRQANENGYRKPKGVYRWIVSADGMNGYATILIKRIGNQLKAFAVHFHVLGRREAEIFDFCTVLRR